MNARTLLLPGAGVALVARDAGALEVMQKPYSIEALTRLLVAH